MAVSTIIYNKSTLSQATIQNVQKVSESFVIISMIKLELETPYKHCINIADVLNECNQFVKNTNNDILILSGDGFEYTMLNELTNVLGISERHAAVSPRGMNMGILSVPAFSYDLPLNNSAEHKKTYDLIVDHMPRYHILPYPSPECVLLRGSLVKKFGFLDTSCMCFDDAVIAWCLKRGQVGYSSIAANKLFMYNTSVRGSGYLPSKQFAYTQKITESYRSYGLSVYDRFAGVISDTYHKKTKILLCMYQLAPFYNGTAEHAFSLAKRLVTKYSDKYEFHLMIHRENADFFKVHHDFSKVIYPEQLKDTYHLGITFSQIFQTELLVLLNAHCLKIASTVLDLISYRCTKFAVNTDMLAFSKSIQYSDGIITISDTVKYDLASAFPIFADEVLKKTRSIFISNADKLAHKHFDNRSLPFNDFILVFGNHYEHKLINLIYPYLKKIKQNFIIVGYSQKTQHKNICAYPSGSLSYEFIDKLYKSCTALLFPSEYEGYGLPVVSALEKGKMVIVNNTEINRELQTSFPQYKDKFLFFNTFDEIKMIIETTAFSTDPAPAPLGRTYDDVATETELFISEVLALDVDFNKLLARNELTAMMNTTNTGTKALMKLFIKTNYPAVFDALKRTKNLLKRWS